MIDLPEQLFDPLPNFFSFRLQRLNFVGKPRCFRRGLGRLLFGGLLFGAKARNQLDGLVNPLFQAAVDATEEAVLCSLWAAVDTVGREGRLVRALPREKVLELYRGRGR